MNRYNFDPNSYRIKEAHKRLKAAYNREKDAVVPVVDPNSGISLPKYTAKDVLTDMDKMLEHSVMWANGLAMTDNDWPPFLNTFCGVPMVPEAFGSEVMFVDDGTAYAPPFISDIEQVWTMKPKKVGDSSMIKRLFEWVDLSQRKLGTEVPLWTTDIQSPFSVAVQIVEHEEILMACYTNPKAIHHLCRMITDFTIDFMKQHIAQMEHACFPGRNFPSISENIGICIADDTPLVMLSPDMYMEFAYPYNAELGEIFGGIHIHSCGDYRHNLDSLLKLPTLKSIQLHAGKGEFILPKTAEEDCAFNRARKQITYFVDSGNIAAGDGYKDRSQDHYVEYVLPRLKAGDMTGCILQSCGVSPDLPDVDSALKWTRQQV